MGVFSKVKDFEKKKAQRKADAMSVVESPSIKPQSESVTHGFNQMGRFDANKPTLEKVDPNKVYESTRSQALGGDAAQTDPQKTMESWNASPYEYWTEQAKANPENAYAIVNQMMASNETPEEKAKREKRERLAEVFNNLGNLIGNAANLYYTSKGGQYIDLNAANEKHRARMDAIKAKQDALKQRQDELLMQYKVADIQAARDAAAKKEEREYNAKVAQNKVNTDAKAAELKHLRELGVINAKQANELIKLKTKAEYDNALAKIKHGYNVALKDMDKDKVLTSLTGSDGNIYTRNTKLSNEEIRMLAKYVEDFTPYTHVDEDSGKETIDYIGALADAAESGAIPTDVLEQMGMKKGKASSNKGNSLGLGIGSNNNSGNKLGIGL